MKLNKVIGVLFLLITSVGFSFAVEMDEKKEENQRIIIPTQYKNLQIHKNCFKRLIEKIEHTNAYQLFDNKIVKNADKLIVQNAKGIMVAGLAGMQMLISNYLIGAVVYTVQQEAGNGIAQYGIHKKINPKLLIMLLMGMSFLVQWLCTFDTYGQVDEIRPSDFNNSTGIFNDTMGNITNNYGPEAYQSVLNNCLIDLYYFVYGPGYEPNLTHNYTVGAYNNAVNNCLDNINVIVNGIADPGYDYWKFLTDFQYSFLISVVYTATYILQELGKSKRTIKSQTDVNCMQTQSDDTLTEEQLDDLTLDNNIAGRLLYKGLNEVKSTDVGCMATEEASASVITTQTDSGSSFVTPNVTPEKLRVNSPQNSRGGTFRIVYKGDKNMLTQTPQRDQKSLLDYANMQADQEGKELIGRVKDEYDPQLHFVLDLD